MSEIILPGHPDFKVAEALALGPLRFIEEAASSIGAAKPGDNQIVRQITPRYAGGHELLVRFDPNEPVLKTALTLPGVHQSFVASPRSTSPDSLWAIHRDLTSDLRDRRDPDFRQASERPVQRLQRQEYPSAVAALTAVFSYFLSSLVGTTENEVQRAFQ